MLSPEDLFVVVKAFFEEKGLVRQHLDSYNDFIEHGLQEVIDSVGEIEIPSPEGPFKVVFGKVKVGRPRVKDIHLGEKPLYPMEARIRNLTYAAPIILEMRRVQDGKEYEPEEVEIGDIPVMLRSKICLLNGMPEEELIAVGEDPDDPGGYFIINGSERVIVSLEDLAPNRILVDIDTRRAKPIYRAKVLSTILGFRSRVEVSLKPDGVIYVSMPRVPSEIPFPIVMRALGVETDREIAEMVSADEEMIAELDPSFEACMGIFTREDAIIYIGNRVAHGQTLEYRINKAEQVLDKYFLPHLGRTEEARRDKAVFLAEMARRVIELKLGRRKPDDKDHMKNKRLKLAGPLLADIFSTAFKSLCRDMRYQLQRLSHKKYIKLRAAVREGVITEKLQHALATGNWGRGRVGITQLLERTNMLSMLSHLRRVQSPLSRSQPNFEARDLHSTQWGRLCPNETPEGANCGLVKNLALMACLSVGADKEHVIKALYELGVVPREEADRELRLKGAIVFVDGFPIGYCTDHVRLVEEFKALRRAGKISPEVNIGYYEGVGSNPEVYVNCDPGRIRRPLIVVENGKPKLTLEHIEKLRKGELKFEDLVREGVIEYLDAEEEENTYIALKPEDITPEHTHLEIAPYAILGICAGIIPFAEYNQSPRNSYEAAMAKQALGFYASNYMFRVDTRAHILHYPQKPLVTTKPIEVIGYSKRPSGQNCIVAVLCFGGYNMEDAIVFNKASIDRGLARSTLFKLYEAARRTYPGGLKDEFKKPEPGIRGYKGDKYYVGLEADGIVRLEQGVKDGDVLVGRLSPPRFMEEYGPRMPMRGAVEMRDTSVALKAGEKGVVDEVFVTEDAEGNRLVKVKVRDNRIPEIGDKFASRHGQKGVIGAIYPPEDMPFTEDGVVPDIIINPHAIPSRMTIGQFLESMAGKVAAMTGHPVDGTPFVGVKPEEIERMLIEAGFSYTGREVMYNGMTGEKYVADIFVGIVYYQRLHHMVADKIHARAKGRVQILTRQPTEGRARGGGLRFGEMERDCLIGHGAAMLLKDRLLDESDRYVMLVCKKCGFIAYYDARKRKYVCRLCGDEAEIYPVVVSYAFKLLLQEIMSLCIAPRLILGDKV
ncbi:DNA-directed RNA polymerase subunit B [Candidatus Bathyarchaeota archaeon ex4484_135]|nr:MAG: DNA-directed RNA polymerase subunit B [Candidatus Bathyarchaeota archaeon ex4484_135]